MTAGKPVLDTSKMDAAQQRRRLREYLAKNGLPGAPELPDELRVPLHSLQADLDFLFARLDEGDDVRAMVKDSIRNRLSQIEYAAYCLVNKGAA